MNGASLGQISWRIHREPGEWLTYEADCPCGEPAVWNSRAIQVGPPGAAIDPHNPRYTTVEYRIDCQACDAREAMDLPLAA